MSYYVDQDPTKPTYEIPLGFDDNTITNANVDVTLPEASYTFYFNLNSVEVTGNNLYLSCLGTDGQTIYFGSYRCVFGTYINELDNGCLHKFFFKVIDGDSNAYPTITFDALNKGVKMYAVLR
jgi:hypothetical protein